MTTAEGPGNGGQTEPSAQPKVGCQKPYKGVMATERTSMRITREILRQKWVLGLSNRAVAAALSLSSGKV